MNIERILAIGLVTLTVLAGCGGNVDSTGTTTATATATIGPAGGTVTGPNDLRIEIPAGALDSNVEIGIRASSAGAPALPEGADPASPVYEFTPHGIAFNKPVTISLASADDPAVKPVLMAEQGDAGWTTVNAVQSAGRVSWQVMGFSWSSGPVDCLIPRGSTDPHPCVWSRSQAVLSSQPAGVLTQTGFGSYETYRLGEEATVSLTFRYTVVADCANPTVRIVRYRPDVRDTNGRAVETVLLDGSAPLTTLSPGGHSISGEVTLPSLAFSYTERAEHYVQMRMQCNRTHENRHVGTGGIVIVDSSAMVAPALPLITQQPADQSVTEPAPAVFSAAASGGAQVKWQRSNDGGATWADIAGATSASYTTPPTTAADHGAKFHAVFKNSAGSVETNPATLSVTRSVNGTVDGKIAAGSNHSCAVAAAGTLYCWGSGINGEIGDGAGVNRAEPTLVSGLTEVSAVVAGHAGTCAIHGATSTLSCWGQVNTAALGLQPVQVRAGPVRAVALGSNHSCLIDATGGRDAVACWGENDEGQLGNGTTLRSASPTPVRFADGSAFEGAVAVVAGTGFSCAQRATGEVWCWGRDIFFNQRTVPERVTRPDAQGLDTEFLAGGGLVAGPGHACALEAGSLQPLCWGFNPAGQLGDGTTNGHNQARPVAITGVSRLFAGTTHTCAVRATDLVCWGTAYMGNTASYDELLFPDAAGSPASLSGVANPVLAGDGGATHTCVLRANGNVMCWGWNNAGQIGSGAVGSNEFAYVPASTTAGAVFWKP